MISRRNEIAAFGVCRLNFQAFPNAGTYLRMGVTDFESGSTPFNTGNTVIEWAAFLVVSILLLAALRPVARAHQRTRASIKTGTAALVGQTATVVERI